MQFIESFTLVGKVEGLFFSNSSESLVSTPVEQLDVIIRGGIICDNHCGIRFVDSREEAMIKHGFKKKKTCEIANHREFSAISVEEKNQIAEAMNLPEIPNGSLGENLLISGIPNFTLLPVGTLLFFKHGNTVRTAVLLIYGENWPCIGPGNIIQSHFSDRKKLAPLFVEKALNKRGVVGSIFSSGTIHVGDTVIAEIPQRYIYQPPQ